MAAKKKKQSTDLLAELAKKPPQVKVAILIGAMILGGGLYYQFVYSGLVDARKSEESTKRREQGTQAKLVKQLDERKKLVAEKRMLDKEVERMQKALPTEAELPAFFQHLQHKAGDAHVNIKSWKRMKESPMGEFIKVPVAMEITGNYHQIMHYFSLLGPKPVDPKAATAPNSDGPDENAPAERIVTVESLVLSGADAKNDEIVLSAKFIASTFRKEEAADVTRKRQKAAAPAKPGGVKGANEKRAKQLDKAAGTEAGMATPGEAGGGTKAGINKLKPSGPVVPK